MSNSAHNVLCIADSSTRLSSLARTIKQLGYQVHTTFTPDQAVAVVAASANRIDAIVMDEDMVIDGFTLAQSFKAALSNVPIVLVCDKGSGGKPPPAGVDFVTVNGSHDQIAAALEKLLARSSGAARG